MNRTDAVNLVRRITGTTRPHAQTILDAAGSAALYAVMQGDRFRSGAYNPTRVKRVARDWRGRQWLNGTVQQYTITVTKKSV